MRIAKNQQVNTTVHDVKEERDKRYAVVKSYGGTRGHVTVAWAQNETQLEDQMCELYVGGEKVIIHAEDLRKAVRWV